MMKMLRATKRNNRMNGLNDIQPNHEAKQKMKSAETTALAIHDAFDEKSKYATSATLATKTIIP
jgi:hypothetical protein